MIGEVVMNLNLCLVYVICFGFVVMLCDNVEKFIFGKIEKMIVIV